MWGRESCAFIPILIESHAAASGYTTLDSNEFARNQIISGQFALLPNVKLTHS